MEETEIYNDSNESYVTEDFIKALDLRIDALFEYVRVKAPKANECMSVSIGDRNGAMMTMMRGDRQGAVLVSIAGMLRSLQLLEEDSKKEYINLIKKELDRCLPNS